jgi:hypothetical protein
MDKKTVLLSDNPVSLLIKLQARYTQYYKDTYTLFI